MLGWMEIEMDGDGWRCEEYCEVGCKILVWYGVCVFVLCRSYVSIKY